VDGVTTVVDFGNLLLNDQAGFNSVDWNNRYLLADDGSTTMIDWSNPAAMHMYVNVVVFGTMEVNSGMLSANGGLNATQQVIF
jgi:hypothetical protein